MRSIRVNIRPDQFHRHFSRAIDVNWDLGDRFLLVERNNRH